MCDMMAKLVSDQRIGVTCHRIKTVFNWLLHLINWEGVSYALGMSRSSIMWPSMLATMKEPYSCFTKRSHCTYIPLGISLSYLLTDNEFISTRPCKVRQLSLHA